MRIRWALPMRVGSLAFLLATVFSGIAQAADGLKPWAGGPTPSLKLRDLQDRAIDLAALKGTVVVINFWATWCEPCRDEMPSLERLRTKLEGRPFEVFAVNYGESREKVERFVSRLGLAVPVLLDRHKEAAEAWKVRGLPMTFVVDAEGHVRFATFGERDWSEGEPHRAIEALVQEAQRARR